MQGCLIPAGMMQFGNEYRINMLGFDPQGEYSGNITKSSLITLVKPPILAKIQGGDQTIDPSKDLMI